MTFASCPRVAEVNFLIADVASSAEFFYARIAYLDVSRTFYAVFIVARVHILCHLLADTVNNLVRHRDCVAKFSTNRA